MSLTNRSASGYSKMDPHEKINPDFEQVENTQDVSAIAQAKVRDMSFEDRAAAMRIVHEQDPGIPPWSPRMVKFVLMAMVVCMCGGDSGG